MFGNHIRFTGMSSGMDTQSIVQQLMRAESMRMDRLTRRRQLAMWRQEQFRNVATQLNDFRDEHLSMIRGNNNIMRAGTFRAWDTAVSRVGSPDGSPTHRGITVSASPDAQAGRFDVRVARLSQNARINGIPGVSNPTNGNNVTGTSTLSQLGFFNQPGPTGYEPPRQTITTDRHNPNLSIDYVRNSSTTSGTWVQNQNGWTSISGGNFVTEIVNRGPQHTWDGAAFMQIDNPLFDPDLDPPDPDIPERIWVEDTANTINVGAGGVGVQAFTRREGNQNVTVYFARVVGADPANPNGVQYFRLQRDGDGFIRHTSNEILNVSTAMPSPDDNAVHNVTRQTQVYFEHGGQQHAVQRFADPANPSNNIYVIDRGDGNFYRLNGEPGSFTIGVPPQQVRVLNVESVSAGVGVLHNGYEVRTFIDDDDVTRYFIQDNTGTVHMLERGPGFDETTGRVLQVTGSVTGGIFTDDFREVFTFNNGVEDIHFVLDGDVYRRIENWANVPGGTFDFTDDIVLSGTTVVDDNVGTFVDAGGNSHQVSSFDTSNGRVYFFENALGEFIILENLGETFVPTGVSYDHYLNPEAVTAETNVTFRQGANAFQVQYFIDENNNQIFFANINGVNRMLEEHPVGSYNFRLVESPPNLLNPSAVRDVHEYYEHRQVWTAAGNNTVRTGTTGHLNSNAVGQPWSNWETELPGANGPWRGVDNQGNFFTTTSSANAMVDGQRVHRITTGPLANPNAIFPGSGPVHLIGDGQGGFQLVLRNSETGAFERVRYADLVTNHGFAATPADGAMISVDENGWATVNRTVVNASQGAAVTDTIHTQRFMSTITINNVDINIRSDWNVNQVMNAINSSNAGVNMSFNVHTGHFNLESTRAGANGAVNITADDAGFMSWALNLDGNFQAEQRTYAGQNALVQVRSEGETAWRDLTFNAARPNQFTYRDHNISITGLTAAEVAAATEFDADGAVVDGTGIVFNVETTRDVAGGTERTMQAIREFVEQYNALVLMLQNLHSTNRPRSNTGGQRSFFEPLLESERREMSDREIERWEEQAQRGLLHRDNTLRRIQADMRRQINDGVLLEDGRRIFLHQIGITADGTMPGQSGAARNIGLLRIDEDRLTSMLESNPELVEGLFTSARPVGSAAHGLNSMELRDRTGLAHRLSGIIHEVTRAEGALTRMAGDGDAHHTNRLSTQIRTYDRRIDRMQDWLIRREQQLFRQFSIMEQAMARSHSQMDALFMFGGA